MANEEMQYETILERKKDEARARQVDKPNALKATARTHKSLLSKIKDDIKESYGEWKEDKIQSKLMRAFNRYNKKYTKVVKAVEVANEDKEDKENYELASDYADVAKYDRRLAKYGVRLLKHDIQELVKADDLTAKQIKTIEKARRLKVPKFLVEKISGIGQKINNFKKRKEIKKATEEYIKDSLRGAVYTKEGLLKEEIDQKVIDNLGTKTEDGYTLDKMRKFISKDGKSPVFKDDKEDELGKKSKIGTDLPPVAPEATVEKQQNKTVIQNIMSMFDNNKVELSKPSEKQEETKTTTEDIKEEKTETKEEKIEIKEENNKWSKISELSNLYSERIKNAQNDEEKVRITEEYNQELDKIVGNKEQHVGKKESKKNETLDSDKKEIDNIEPIEVKPQIQDSKKIEDIKPISTPPTRVAQVSDASKMTVNFADLKKLREQLEADKAEVAKNNQEIEKYTKIVGDLKAKKDELQRIKEEFYGVREAKERSEIQAAALKNTAEELGTEVTNLYAEFGPVKK